MATILTRARCMPTALLHGAGMVMAYDCDAGRHDRRTSARQRPLATLTRLLPNTREQNPF